MAADRYPPPRRAWTFLFVLGVISVLALADRQLLYILVEPMRRSLQVTDAQLAIIQGPAFVVAYTIVAVPMGRFADRYDRRLLLWLGLGFASVMTVACGLAAGFWTLFAARAGVGIGEAVLGPAGISLLADHFPPEKRGRAIGLLSSSSGIGAGLSFLLGSLALTLLPDPASVSVPVVGPLLGWQLAFLFAGLCGFLIAPMLLLFREPKRKELATADFRHAAAWPLLRKHVSGHGLAFSVVIGAGALLALAAYGVNAWSAVYLMREFGMSAPKAGLIIGVSVITAGLIQGPLSGVIGDALARRRTGGRLLIVPVGAAVALPLSAAWPAVDSPELAIVLLALANITSATALLAIPAMLQELAPNEIRGVLLGSSAVITNIVGAGVGPVSVALIEEWIYHDATRLGPAIATVTLPCYVATLLLGLLGLRSYARARSSTLAMVSASQAS